MKIPNTFLAKSYVTLPICPDGAWERTSFSIDFTQILCNRTAAGSHGAGITIAASLKTFSIMRVSIENVKAYDTIVEIWQTE